MNNNKTHSSFEDDEIADIPVSPTVRVIRGSQTKVRGGLSWSELERLGSVRLWGPILGLPSKGDDFWPRALHEEEDKYLV